MDRNNNMAAGLLLGLAVGAVAGMLMAPKSGVENRAMLQEKMGEIQEKIGELSEKVRRNRGRFGDEIEETLRS